MEKFESIDPNKALKDGVRNTTIAFMLQLLFYLVVTIIVDYLRTEKYAFKKADGLSGGGSFG